MFWIVAKNGIKNNCFVLRIIKKKHSTDSWTKKIVGVLSCCFSVTLLEGDYFATLHLQSLQMQDPTPRSQMKTNPVPWGLKNTWYSFQGTKTPRKYCTVMLDSSFQLIHDGLFKCSASPSFLHFSYSPEFTRELKVKQLQRCHGVHACTSHNCCISESGMWRSQIKCLIGKMSN